MQVRLICCSYETANLIIGKKYKAIDYFGLFEKHGSILIADTHGYEWHIQGNQYVKIVKRYKYNNKGQIVANKEKA